MREDCNDIRDRFLLAILPHVVFEGWSEAAIVAGTRDLKNYSEFDSETFERSFPGGLRELATHFANWTDRSMLVEMGKLDMSSLKMRERISASLRCRIKVLSPHREAVRCCMSFLTSPLYAGIALKCTYNTVSEIWYGVGDQSTDFNFYSKRAILAPVLGSTILYWLSDEGDGQGNFPDTWAFIDRRIADVLNIFGARHKLSKRFSNFPKPLSVCKRIISATVRNRV